MSTAEPKRQRKQRPPAQPKDSSVNARPKKLGGMSIQLNSDKWLMEAAEIQDSQPLSLSICRSDAYPCWSWYMTGTTRSQSFLRQTDAYNQDHAGIQWIEIFIPIFDQIYSDAWESDPSVCLQTRLFTNPKLENQTIGIIRDSRVHFCHFCQLEIVSECIQ